jgi:hypothetical protein
MDWSLQPGDTIKRTELHAMYGGGGQGGIAPCIRSPNVLVFTDRSVGQEHGYLDQWEGDTLDYAGEGQRGDQTLTRGKRAILRHHEEGRVLRVFEGVRGVVRYKGEYEVDPLQPYRWIDAPETGGGPRRKVLLFRLRPVN